MQLWERSRARWSLVRSAPSRVRRSATRPAPRSRIAGASGIPVRPRGARRPRRRRSHNGLRITGSRPRRPLPQKCPCLAVELLPRFRRRCRPWNSDQARADRGPSALLKEKSSSSKGKVHTVFESSACQQAMLSSQAKGGSAAHQYTADLTNCDSAQRDDRFAWRRPGLTDTASRVVR